MRGAAPSICVVAPARAGVDEAIVRHTLHLGQTLAAAGWRVHVLWCGAAAAKAMTQAAVVAEAQWHWSDFNFPATAALNGPCLFDALHDSDRTLHALRQLHKRIRFDVIQFPERGGLGFRAIQAKQTGQAFADAQLVTTVHGCTRALRDAREQWLVQPEDLTLDYMERYTRTHADHTQTAPSASGHEQWMRSALACASGSQAYQPLVTICIPYFNLHEFLEETLDSIAQQTYSNLEVIVINDGSTQADAVAVFERMRSRFPHFRFVEQPNAGIGATRNCGLQMARGEYFLPVDADNIADPHMVHRFVAGMQHNRDIAAMTCYFLAFRESADIAVGRFAYAYKPTGGPRILGCLQNIYGDGNAIFRTEALRAVGGFETDRDTSFEDWEVFVKLVNAGQRVEVLPDFLFYYRHRDTGFSRATNAYRNHQRVLRRFVEIESLPEHERALLWNWLVGSQQRLAELDAENQTRKGKLTGRPYRVVTALSRAMKRLRQASGIFSAD
jgi:glycosyltransferase involved in cell wall biosynthesis